MVRQIKETCCVVAFSATEQPSSGQRQQPVNLTYQLPDGSFVEVPILPCKKRRQKHFLVVLFDSHLFVPLHFLQLGSESYMAPEIIFRPELLGCEQKGA